jgi:hypothetical protein
MYLLYVFILYTIVHAQSNDQTNALKSLYRSTNGDYWFQNKYWMTNNPACTWYGVYCDDDDNVVVLNLYNNNMTGTISDLGPLTHLMSIYFYSNNIIGNLDNITFMLYKKTTISLENNFMSGYLPTPQPSANVFISNNYWYCPLPKWIIETVNCYPPFRCCNYIDTSNSTFSTCGQSFQCQKYSFANKTSEYITDEKCTCV